MTCSNSVEKLDHTIRFCQEVNHTIRFRGQPRPETGYGSLRCGSLLEAVITQLGTDSRPYLSEVKVAWDERVQFRKEQVII